MNRKMKTFRDILTEGKVDIKALKKELAKLNKTLDGFKKKHKDDPSAGKKEFMKMADRKIDIEDILSKEESNKKLVAKLKKMKGKWDNNRANPKLRLEISQALQSLDWKALSPKDKDAMERIENAI
jgi:hypothetical protein